MGVTDPANVVLQYEVTSLPSPGALQVLQGDVGGVSGQVSRLCEEDAV